MANSTDNFLEIFQNFQNFFVEHWRGPNSVYKTYFWTYFKLWRKAVESVSSLHFRTGTGKMEKYWWKNFFWFFSLKQVAFPLPKHLSISLISFFCDSSFYFYDYPLYIQRVLQKKYIQFKIFIFEKEWNKLKKFSRL